MLNKKALAGTPSTPPVYVEDVFSTYLYTGNSSTQTITNNIDLSTKGGLVWLKCRSTASSASHQLVDTVRGRFAGLSTNTTNSEDGNGLGSGSAFLTNGFTVGNVTSPKTNTSGETFCSWTFCEQAKFFDIVTYTGNGGSGGRTISHNLGSAPGMIILKVTNLAGDDWYVYHRSIPTRVLALNSTNSTDPTPPQFVFGNGTTTVAPTSTEFTIGSTVNGNTYNYIVYLFAHDAGGFGAAGTDNVISCGSYTGNGGASFIDVNLGWEPQYILAKRATGGTGNWVVYDVMRGLSLSSNGDAKLCPNLSDAEVAASQIDVNATGFTITAAGTELNANGSDYIYMAIRRPMKTPTSGTEVFSTNLETSSTSPQTLTTGFPVDLTINTLRVGGAGRAVSDRLRGGTTTLYNYLSTQSTSAESQGTSVGIAFDNSTGIVDSGFWNSSDAVFWNFKRATGFFDTVCYSGTGSNRTVTHNLGVVPELMIVKRRNTTAHWMVYAQPLGNTSRLLLSSSNGESTGQTTVWNSTTPTSSVFSLGTSTDVNASGSTYVAYLFASVAGVSKVGSYTGNGSNQTINCGFTAGARFVLIKRTDSTGDWCVFDTARGIVSGNDPFLQLNTTDAETTGEDAVDPANSGFIINETTEALNTNNATYIYLAIA